jgi:hypothetical protein
MAHFNCFLVKANKYYLLVLLLKEINIVSKIIYNVGGNWALYLLTLGYLL